MNDGGTAFPIQHSVEYAAPNASPGMSLRDYFAAAALQGLLASGHFGEKDLAETCFLYADDMLAQREKQ